MKKKTYNHAREELKREKRISYLQIISIIILLALLVLLAIFSDDSSYIAIQLRKLFK